MGQAHDHDTSHSTKYGTMMMQATVWQDASSQLSNSVPVQCIVGHSLSPGLPI
jgi:hypothetical protein